MKHRKRRFAGRRPKHVFDRRRLDIALEVVDVLVKHDLHVDEVDGILECVKNCIGWVPISTQCCQNCSECR